MYIQALAILQSPFDHWVEPSTSSRTFFLAIMVTIVLMWVVLIRRAGWHWLHTGWVFLAMGLSSIVQGSAWLRTESLPPPPFLFMAVHLGAGVALVLSPAGKRFAARIPLAWLVGFQAFRLPLEIWLHRAHGEGTVPEQMTYSGQNFDILTGVLAIAGFMVITLRPRSARAVAWGFNVVGFGLLLAVAVIATRSLPYPFSVYPPEETLLLAFQWPYGWILTLAVTSAWIVHLMTFRRLLTRTDGR